MKLFPSSYMFVTVIIFTILFLTQSLFAQPGPNRFCFLIYDSAGKQLALGEDIEVYSIGEAENKSAAFYMIIKSENNTFEKKYICCDIIEGLKSKIEIIYDGDTMNIIFRKYSATKLYADSLLFKKGRYDINYESDNCIKKSKQRNERIIIKNEDLLSQQSIDETTASYTMNELTAFDIANNISLADSAGEKIVKFNFTYESTNYNGQCKLPKDISAHNVEYNLYNIVIEFEKKNPDKIVDVRFYPKGY